MQLFYDPTLDATSKNCVFGREESRHIIRVLRKKVGDELSITNGKGSIFVGQISDPSLQACKVEITDREKIIEPMYSLHLAVAPTKNIERFEWFLEKATEIGIDEITPVICDHSERKVLKYHRLEKIIQSAMKQSLRPFLPKLNEAVKLKDFLEQDPGGLKFIAHCQEGEKVDLKRRVAPDKDILVLIGPEGDFSEAEIDLAEEKGFWPVSLGDYRLRTETAAILACSTVRFINTR